MEAWKMLCCATGGMVIVGSYALAWALARMAAMSEQLRLHK